MRVHNRWLAMLTVGLFVVGACGGGGGGTSTEPSQPAASVGESVAPSEGAASTAPSTEPSAAPSSGGGTTAGVCELVTAAELSGIFGVASVTTTVIAGPPDTCIVASDTGDPLTSWSLSRAQAQVVFDSLALPGQSVAVPGIGDKAAIVENTGLLVLKGDGLLVIAISGGADVSEEEAVEASKQIGEIAAGRM